MRRNLRAMPVMVLACALFALLAAPAGAQLAQKPDLVVSSAAEPPDFIATEDGGDFLNSFTVDNQGRRRARSITTARAYLSLGRVMSADDRRRRVGSRRVKPLSAGQSITRRLIVRIPAAFRQGEYFLIVCADVRNVVDEINDRANCHVSGQKLRIAPDAARGGPPGPRGEPGPPGPGSPTVTFPRKVMPLGTATVSGYGPWGPGDNEGSTEQFDLGEVGGVRIRALCRATTNGDGRLPGDPVDNDNSWDRDGDEAKVLVYMDRPEGTMSFDGDHGSRFNVAAGFGRTRDTDGENPDDNPTTAPFSGGEGQHQFLATARDPEARIQGSDGDFDPREEVAHAFRSASGIVSTTDGTDFILNVYAGVDVLAVGATNCVFGGSATRIG